MCTTLTKSGPTLNFGVKEMKERLEKFVNKVSKTVWSHRACYAGLALAYAAGVFGIVDKESVHQCAMALYVALFAQRR